MGTQQLELEGIPAPKQAITTVGKSPMELAEFLLAAGRDISPEQMKSWMEMQFTWQAEQARLAWIADMARLKADMPVILKTKHKQGGIRNGKEQADYWHVELDKACDLLIPALLKYNFTHRWETVKSDASWIEIACVIQHDMGHSERTILGGPPDNTGGKNAIQAVGSSKYYLERYTFLGALGIAPKGQDTDGVAPGIPTGLRAERCAEIDSSNSLEQLRARYQVAYKEAREQKDNDATLLYTDAYEKRKEVLMGGAQ